MNLNTAKAQLFSPANQVSPSDATKKVPEHLGVYAILIKQPQNLPSPFNRYLTDRGHRCLYVGKSSHLYRRMVRYDLDGKGDSTFFQSLGAILGYRPPPGSLIGKTDQNNFRFSQEDTEKIVAWATEHLVVAWLELSITQQATYLEKQLIKHIRPLLNIRNNPSKLRELIELRQKCREIAKGIDLTKNLEREKKVEYIQSYLDKVCQIMQNLPQAEIARTVGILTQARIEGKRIFVMGNGGSAAMASHFACDLGKGTVQEGKTRFKVISLNDNVPLLTAYANDFGYETVFAEPLASLAEPGDVAIAISSSGNSPNVLRAMDVARERGLKTIGITGFEGGKLKEKVDVCVIVPADSRQPDGMQHAEDGQWVVLHAIFVAIRQGME